MTTSSAASSSKLPPLQRVFLAEAFESDDNDIPALEPTPFKGRVIILTGQSSPSTMSDAKSKKKPLYTQTDFKQDSDSDSDEIPGLVPVDGGGPVRTGTDTDDDDDGPPELVPVPESELANDDKMTLQQVLEGLGMSELAGMDFSSVIHADERGGEDDEESDESEADEEDESEGEHNGKMDWTPTFTTVPKHTAFNSTGFGGATATASTNTELHTPSSAMHDSDDDIPGLEPIPPSILQSAATVRGCAAQSHSSSYVDESEFSDEEEVPGLVPVDGDLDLDDGPPGLVPIEQI